MHRLLNYYFSKVPLLFVQKLNSAKIFRSTNYAETKELGLFIGRDRTVNKYHFYQLHPLGVVVLNSNRSVYLYHTIY